MGLRNKTLFVLSLLISFFLGYYSFNLQNVKFNEKIEEIGNLKYDFFNVIKDNEEENVDYGKMTWYNYAKSLNYNLVSVENYYLNFDKIDINASKGVVEVTYGFVFYLSPLEEEGNVQKMDSYNINATWYIEKNNGRWIIYDIDGGL